VRGDVLDHRAYSFLGSCVQVSAHTGRAKERSRVDTGCQRRWCSELRPGYGAAMLERQSQGGVHRCLDTGPTYLAVGLSAVRVTAREKGTPHLHRQIQR
jgi:hypothetical protein